MVYQSEKHFNPPLETLKRESQKWDFLNLLCLSNSNYNNPILFVSKISLLFGMGGVWWNSQWAKVSELISSLLNYHYLRPLYMETICYLWLNIILPPQINSKGIDKLEKLNRQINHDWKNEKVAAIVENIQITEIWTAQFDIYMSAPFPLCL